MVRKRDSPDFWKDWKDLVTLLYGTPNTKGDSHLLEWEWETFFLGKPQSTLSHLIQRRNVFFEFVLSFSSVVTSYNFRIRYENCLLFNLCQVNHRIFVKHTQELAGKPTFLWFLLETEVLIKIPLEMVIMKPVTWSLMYLSIFMGPSCWRRNTWGRLQGKIALTHTHHLSSSLRQAIGNLCLWLKPKLWDEGYWPGA